MANTHDLLVGLDIGTTKICCIVAEVTETMGVDIKGLGFVPSTGMTRGRVNNIEKTVSGIQQAVEEASRMSGCEIEAAYIGIAGGHISGFNSQGIVAVKNKTVSADDIRRVKEAAMVVRIPEDREIIHRIPQEYKVDNRTGIKDPINMNGFRLEVDVHIVTGAVSAVQDIANCVLKAGLDINDLVLESVASAEAVLTPQEKQIGVALIDIGGGTSDIAVFSGDSIRHTAVLPYGGDSLSSDLSIGLNISLDTADQLKTEYGCCYAPNLTEDLIIEVPMVSGQEYKRVSRQVICDILEPRVEEIMNLINRQLVNSGFDKQVHNIVVTGGTALLEGIPELAYAVFDMPVRVGCPTYIGGLSEKVRDPRFSTAVGLILYGLTCSSPVGSASLSGGKGSLLERILSKFRSKFKN
jgi:cell division protein FtsA